jgi:hypothetical protein
MFDRHGGWHCQPGRLAKSFEILARLICAKRSWFKGRAASRRAHLNIANATGRLAFLSRLQLIRIAQKRHAAQEDQVRLKACTLPLWWM